MNASRRRHRLTRSHRIAVLAVSALTIGLVGVAPAQATSIDNLFELDGDPTASAAAGDDWSTLVDGAGTPPGFVAETAMPIVDVNPTAGVDVSFFAGGGSKDIRPLELWGHSDGDVAPDKDELLNAFASAYRTGTAATPAADRDLILFFGADRFSNGGDAAMGFWFFKNEVSLNPNGSFNGTHTAAIPASGSTPASGGDLLVISDFSGGGKVSTIKVFEWIGGRDPLRPLFDTDAAGNDAIVDCGDAAHDDHVCAIENSAPVSTQWTYTPKAGASGTYPTGSFLEGGLNVSQLVTGVDDCFAGFLAETRSSTSPTAQLKDFVLGGFPVCAPSTTLSASPAAATPATVHRGESQTFSFSETNDGDDTLDSPYITTNNTGCGVNGTISTVTSGDTNSNGDLDPGETFVFQCTLSNLQADTTLVGTGHGTDSRGKDVTFCETGTTPANTVCDAQERASAAVKVINPQTTLTVSASPTIVHAGDTVTLSFTETNNGTRAEDNLTNVSISAPRCSSAPVLNPASQSATGGVAADGELDFGESWTFSCTFTAAATDSGATIAAIASGTDSIGSTVTYCANPATPGTGIYCSQNERATTSITIINPSSTLRATASALVTYTFVETNDGDSVLTSPTLSVVTGCSTPVVTVKSANTDSDIDVGESWTYTCTKTVAGPTSTDGDSVTGTAGGTDAAGGNVTYCTDPTSPPAGTICDQDERDSVTVKIIHNAPN